MSSQIVVKDPNLLVEKEENEVKNQKRKAFLAKYLQQAVINNIQKSKIEPEKQSDALMKKKEMSVSNTNKSLLLKTNSTQSS